MIKRFLLFTLFLFACAALSAQNISTKNLDLEGNIDKWFNSHFDSANVKPMIGPLPIVSPPRRTTNVFFIEESRDWNRVSMMYDHQEYNNVRMKYDIDKQVIYILNPQTLQPVILNQELVNWIKSPLGTFKPRENSTGYYLIIFEGNNLSLVKESRKDLIVNAGEFEYKRTDNIYLLQENLRTTVRNPKSLIKQFPNHKKEIKRFMRQKESKEVKRSSKEDYLVLIAEYCDNLANL